MQRPRVKWCGIFGEAYTYSSKYLLFTLTVVVLSVLWVWLYEKPQFYKVSMYNLSSLVCTSCTIHAYVPTLLWREVGKYLEYLIGR